MSVITREVVRLDHFVRAVINAEDFDGALHLTVDEADAEFEVERGGIVERTSLMRLAAEGVPAEVLRDMLAGAGDSDAAEDVGASDAPLLETIHDRQAIADAMADTVESPSPVAPRKRGRPGKGT